METVTVTKHGPLFSGQASAAVTAFLNEATTSVADEGVNMVHAQLGSVLRHPTGYYESRIVTDRATDGSTVTDSGVIYGPWLEGVSSRNQSTRFKGYATFRRITQKLQDKAGPIANETLRRFISRMN